MKRSEPSAGSKIRRSHNIYLFTDASFNPTTKTAVVGFILLDQLSSSVNSEMIHLHVLHKTTNSRAELEAILCGLEFVKQRDITQPITLYTDCQTAARLPQRRSRLESCDFKSQKNNKDLSQADLYRAFYRFYDDLNPIFKLIPGHLPSHLREPHDIVFALVDRTVRSYLRRLYEE